MVQSQQMFGTRAVITRYVLGKSDFRIVPVFVESDSSFANGKERFHALFRYKDLLVFSRISRTISVLFYCFNLLFFPKQSDFTSW